MEDSTTGRTASLPQTPLSHTAHVEAMHVEAARPQPNHAQAVHAQANHAQANHAQAVHAQAAIADNAALRHELTQLELACCRLKNQPGLVEMLELVQLNPAHARILLGYAEQLATLMRTVKRYTGQLEQLAAVDVDAVAALIIAKRTVGELDQAVTPVIAALHRQALVLAERKEMSPNCHLH